MSLKIASYIEGASGHQLRVPPTFVSNLKVAITCRSQEYHFLSIWHHSFIPYDQFFI